MNIAQKTIKFTLNDKEVEAIPGESIWQVAKRCGDNIPHLCYSPEPGYVADGNCRVCMVEIEGERTLAASCCRTPTEGMVVKSANSDRAQQARKMVMELLVADQPTRNDAHDKNSKLWGWADTLAVDSSRFPAREKIAPDNSHTAMAVNMDACISCQLCMQGCRDVQVNDVIGLSQRGSRTEIVFDFGDPMGQSTCVACGECVQACPTGALMPATAVDQQGISILAKDEQPDRQIKSVCPYCGVGCQLTYNIKDEKLLYVEGSGGPANENRLCVKGRFGFDYVSHKDRLTKPLIRLENKPKTFDDDFDPANPYTHFRDATWEEALDFAAKGLKDIRDNKGKRALAGFGSAKCSNEEAYLFQKLVRTGFGSNNVDHCTRLCHASSVAALLETVGSGAVSAPFNAVEDSDFIIVIGANPTENHPVAATFFKQAVKRGATLTIMDPRGQALKKHATHMMQFKPGGDVSMLNAMMHVIVEEELYDQQYIETNTTGFEKMKAHLKDYAPEKMTEICGIEPETLRTVAREYAKADAAIIFWGMGVSQHIHGTDNARCLISLALMCGQVGRPGTGLHPLRGQNNVQGASDAGLIPMMFPDYQRVSIDKSRSMFESLWNTELDDQPGLTVVEIMDAIHDDEITGMYIMGENPAMSDPDLNHARQALGKLEHLVVQDLFLTETALYADVVLPSSAWPEKDGTVTNTNRQVQMGRKALKLPGDARQDWWITQEIAKRIGLNWSYEHPRDVYNEMTQAMPSLNNISWERVDEENSVTYPCKAPDQPGQDIVFNEGFPTESGRGLFVPARVISPDEEPDDEYPMVLTTGRVLEHWHTGSMTRRANVLDDLEPEAIVTLCASDLAKIDAQPGDKIQVSTRRGTVQATARLDPGLAEGCIFMPFCFVEGAANTLTNPALDPFGKIPEFKFCASRVEKA